MALAAGSPANDRCPKCRSTDVIVALDTAKAVYYLCSLCRHAWSKPKPETARRKASQPKNSTPQQPSLDAPPPALKPLNLVCSSELTHFLRTDIGRARAEVHASDDSIRTC